MSLLWINGRLVDKADAGVSPFDHGFLYGDGVWEPLRVFGGNLFRPDDHLEQLFTSASALEIDIPISRAGLRAAIGATVEANRRTEGYIRVIVTRGPGTVGPDSRKLDPQIMIIAEEYLPFPPELYGHGLHSATGPYPVNVLNPACRHRTLGRPDVVLNKRFALKAGCLEAVLTDAAGHVTGGTEGDLFLVRQAALQPLPLSTSVASQTALDAAGTAIPVAPAIPARISDLFAADEVFLAGTSCGIIGIIKIDGKDIGSGREGPVTRSIREAYHRLTRGASRMPQSEVPP